MFDNFSDDLDQPDSLVVDGVLMTSLFRPVVGPAPRPEAVSNHASAAGTPGQDVMGYVSIDATMLIRELASQLLVL